MARVDLASEEQELVERVAGATAPFATIHRVSITTIGLTLMVLGALVTRLIYLGYPASDFDEQLYSLIGNQMRHGMLPYVDLWDRKPIGLFLLYATFHAIGGDGATFYQLLALLACIVGGFQVWRLGCRLVDSGTAALGSALYCPMMAIFGVHSGQSEIFYVPLLMAMAQLLFIASDSKSSKQFHICMATMLIGGLALQLKYTVLIQCLLFGIMALWIRHRAGRSVPGLLIDAAIFAALGLFPTILAAGYYAYQGSLPDFIFANFQSIGLRAPMPLSWDLTQNLIFAIPLVALTGAGIFVMWRRPTAANIPLWRLALVWVGMSMAGMFMVKTIYIHYYAALIPATILVALPVFDSRQRSGWLAWATVFVGMVAGFNPPDRFADTSRDRIALAQIVQTLSPFVGATKHCLFVFDGPSSLYRLTGSGLPSRIIYPDHLNNDLEARSIPVDPVQEIARIFADRPGAVVTTSTPVTVQNPATNLAVSRELAAHYRPLGTWMLEERALHLYARKPDSDGMAPNCQIRPGQAN